MICFNYFDISLCTIMEKSSNSTFGHKKGYLLANGECLAES